MKFVESYKAGRISLKRARVYALKVLEDSPWEYPRYVDVFFKAGIITLEEARSYAFKYLKCYQRDDVDVFFKAGIITRQEAKPYALKVLEYNPKAFTPEFRELVTKDYSSPVLNQLQRDGVDIETMIDPELRHLLDSLK